MHRLPAIPLLLALCAAAALGLHAPAQQSPLRDSTALLGRSTDATLEVFGPPTYICHGDDDVLVLVWRAERTVTREVAVCGDVAVHVAPVEALPAPDRDRIPESVHLGQSVADLVGRRGNPDRTGSVPVREGPGGHGEVLRRDFALVYGDSWITVAAGRVVDVGTAPVERVFGPR
ncbi:MAG: hypothetical protein AAGB93_03760 [Planctomycetota bacterium]